MEMLGLFLFLIILYFAILAISIVSCILTAISLYTIADRRQISNPWMAWIPFAGSWLIGNIVDDYEAQHGFQRKWRVVLLVLSVLPWVLFIFVYAILFAMMFAMIPQMQQIQYMTPTAEEVVGSMLAILIPIYILLIVVLVAMAAGEMCKAICMYKIFESTVPQKSVKYMLLYLLVPLAGSICLMKCRYQGYEKPRVYYNVNMPPYQQGPMNPQ